MSLTADEPVDHKPTLTPPASVEPDKDAASSSELSEPEVESDEREEILPDHYYDGGKIPVFKPTMTQFRSFKSFINKIDKYGMQSGIVKVIPPKEWKDALPSLDQQVKTIRVKNPITQEFHGTHGMYTQANIEKQRSYNLPQWKDLSEESSHQPPARRGERRRNQEKTAKATRKLPVGVATAKRKPGRPRVRPLPNDVPEPDEDEDVGSEVKNSIPSTPTSPASTGKVKKEAVSDSERASPKPKGRQPKSVSSRRKYNSRDQADVVDEEAFKDFDYKTYNQEEWTSERCQELETAYWKSLTFNHPLYGADMPGSLFDENTESWNVAKLENLLDVIGQKIPGVNTAYLYLGMWKATFAWHLEDVDLYSINYIHFGAPKQWYSISQEDARKFESAMRNVWPNDAKNCDQFLRHKTYLISPQLLQSQYNIKVNRLVHNEGEFVITFPYGYHSGYNLGYNCAESVNFATEAWLEYGRVAKKCHCEADSVWIDVEDIERKLRGEATPEYYEESDDDDDDEDDEDEGPTDLPTPPGSDKGRPRARVYKRKRETNEKDIKPKLKRLRLKFKAPTREPCILCPNDQPFEELLATDDGQQAHRRCALYTPETDIIKIHGSEKICNIAGIDKARLELKCNHCRNKRGAVFQCSQKKCTRAYHATCAASAGVQVDAGVIPVFDVDGTEYTGQGIDFRCRFHRVKRPKSSDRQTCGTSLEESTLIRRFAGKLSKHEVIQAQFFQGEIFAGVVVENRQTEQTLLIEILSTSERIEVEYKWLLVFDPASSQRPIPSENAKPLPEHLAHKSRTTAEDPSSDLPKPDDPFCDPTMQHVWSEFHTTKLARNSEQVAVDMNAPKKVWHYLGRTSTEARAQYTSDLSSSVNDISASFLDSVRAALTASQPAAHSPYSYPTSFPTSYPMTATTTSDLASIRRLKLHLAATARPPQVRPQPRPQDHPYSGRFAGKDSTGVNRNTMSDCSVDPLALRAQQAFLQKASTHPGQGSPFAPPITGHAAPRAPMKKINLNSAESKALEFTSRTSSNPQSSTAMMDSAPLGGFHHSNASSAAAANLSQAAVVGRNQQNPASSSSHAFPASTANMAPVAKMMSSAPSPMANSTTTSSSRPSSAHRTPPTLPTPDRASRSRSDSFNFLGRYPYLQNAALNRPPVYRSPYAADGSFTEVADEWLPTTKMRRPRNVSLSNAYLEKRTPTQRAAVKGHVRILSTDKAMLQEQEVQRRQWEQKQRTHMPPPQPHSLHQPQHLPPQMIQQHSDYNAHEFGSLMPFSQSSAFSATHAYPSLLQQQPGHFPYQSPGLQFSSPQDFQLQMQRDLHSPQSNPLLKNDGTYDSFLRGASSLHTHSHAHGSSQDFTVADLGDGTSGSPLRQGMRAAGGEMLPMMQDRFPN